MSLTRNFVLYWILRACASSIEIDIDEKFSLLNNDEWLNQQWLESEASKYNEMITPLPWDKVFDW